MYQTLMQGGVAAPQAPWWQTPALMVGVFAIIYFFMIRPQQKKQKELQAKANLVESNSLTPQLLKKMAIEKWNGELPRVQGQAQSLISDVLK
mgnify:CR=1 FL=1